MSSPSVGCRLNSISIAAPTSPILKNSTTTSPLSLTAIPAYSYPQQHQQPAPPSPTTQLALFHRHHQIRAGTTFNDDEPEKNEEIQPNREQLHRRDAIVPEDQPSESDRETNCDSGAENGCNVIIVPHVQVTSDHEFPHLYNRAVTAGDGGLLADLQRATLASHQFYAENNGSGNGGGAGDCHQPKGRSPWILRRLYEWSHRAKSREMLKHVHAALDSTSQGGCSEAEGASEDEHFTKMLNVQWGEMFGCCGRCTSADSSDAQSSSSASFASASLASPVAKSSNAGISPSPAVAAEQQQQQISDRDKRRLKAVWELFHSELVFLIRQLLVLRNVYKEPLKKCQVEGCLLGVEPELLFGNLDQLCRISRRFCHMFLALLEEVKCAGPPFETTEMVVQLFKRFAKGPSTISAYQAYCINYKATMEYLGTVRQKEERFVDFERVCMSDPRCVRLQLEDLLIAPLQRITRLPILLREILRYTDGQADRQRLEQVLDQMSENLRSIDDSVQWLHNFERLQQLQHQLIWPSITELESKAYIPDFLKGALSRQFCENLLAHPRRKLMHEGHLEYIENGRSSDCYCFLFNDMFMITKVKKITVKSKKNSSSFSKQEFYIVQRQPVPLDSCVFCDAESDLDTQQNAILKNAFVVIHLTRFYQVLNVYTMQALNKHEKEIWIEKFQESIENYEFIQQKDMLRCTPLYSSLSNSIRRASAASATSQASAQNNAGAGKNNSSSSSASPVLNSRNGVANAACNGNSNYLGSGGNGTVLNTQRRSVI